MSPINDFDPAAHCGAFPSPCISICKINPQTGWCEGCFRTIDEISQWRTATEEVKRMVWMEIKRRQDSIF